MGSSGSPDDELTSPEADAEPNRMNDFEINYDELTDKTLLSKGRFCNVYKGYLHGLHAIKEIALDETAQDDELIGAEIANLRFTRHSNLILFVGACLRPGLCAIVMSFCGGVSLHEYLHLSRSNVRANFDWAISIALQVSQGMAYLHNRDLVHKDLRSRNVFIDGNRVIITDYGLYNLLSMSRSHAKLVHLPVTRHGIFYLAPELIRALDTADYAASFDFSTDVYAFGTIWYELLYAELPSAGREPHSLLFMLGSGAKVIPFTQRVPRELQVIVLKCWSFDKSRRPSFSSLLERFRQFPKVPKLMRSPSHPY